MIEKTTENPDNLINEVEEERHVSSKGYLTTKQEVFCKEYTKDFNGTQAAIRAGYSKHTANEQAAQLLAKLSIKARVDELIEDRHAASKVTQEWVLRGIQEVAKRCLQEIRPLTDKMGVHIKDDKGNPLYVFDSRGANQALEMLAKHTGLFKLSDSREGWILLTQNLGEKKIDPNPAPLTPEEEKQLQELALPKGSSQK